MIRRLRQEKGREHMREPNFGLLGKRVLVLCEHKVLCQAIKLGLKYRLGMDVVENASLPDGLDLVVATALSFVKEESVLPPQAFGQVPILLISDQPPDLRLDREGVFHLGFPFGYEDLCAKATEILRLASGVSHGMRGGQVNARL
jgi:hypothetical protein